jgi:streptogramin lyase
VAFDKTGNLYIADPVYGAIRRVTPDGIISTIFQMPNSGAPTGLAVDSAGNLYIADQWNSLVLKVSSGGTVTTVAGNGTAGFSGDGGPAASAQLNAPRGVAVDASGNLYIADALNNRIRKVSSDGIITTVAGNGSFSYSGDGGPAVNAQLSGPRGLAVAGAGNLFIADSANNRVRKVSSTGVITTAAGNGSSPPDSFTPTVVGDGGPAISAELSHPSGLAVDTAERFRERRGR